MELMNTLFFTSYYEPSLDEIRLTELPRITELLTRLLKHGLELQNMARFFTNDPSSTFINYSNTD